MKLRTNVLVVAAALCTRSFVPAAEIASVSWDNAAIAQGVKAGLGDPSRFNWESVRITDLLVEGGKVNADLTKEGNIVHAHIRGEHIFSVTAKGKGDRDSNLNVTASLEGLDANISLTDRRAEVDVILHIVNHEGCRVWTRAYSHKTTPFTRMTFRVTAVPQPCDIKLLCHIRVDVRNDGTVVLTPISWRPANAEEKVDVQISGQNLPDGWAVIKPLNADTIRVDMDLPFDIGDRTIKNPLASIMEKVMGREFPLGKLPL